MSQYKNVSGDTIDIPQLGVHVIDGDVIETDADLSQNPSFEVSTDAADVTANLPEDMTLGAPAVADDPVEVDQTPADAAPASADTTPAPADEPAPEAVEGTN